MVRREALYAFILIALVIRIENAQSKSNQKPSKCETLDIPNARIRIRARGRLAKIRCHSGYTMIEGDRRLTCIRQEWIGRIPHCIRNGCGAAALKNGDSIELYDGALVHFTCNPGYELEGSTAIFCDGVKWNASLPVCQVPPPNSDHTSCTFETEDFCGWTQGHLDDFDWKWTSAHLNAFTGSLGAKIDHTMGTPSGHYIYADSKEPWTPETVARLFSPILDVPSLTPACVVLFYHVYGPTSGSLNVYIKPESVPFELLVPAMTVTGFNVDVWKIGLMHLDESLEDWFQIILEARGGDGLVVDAAVDDFRVTSGDECIELELKMKEQQTSSTTSTISTMTPNETTSVVTVTMSSEIDGNYEETEITAMEGLVSPLWTFPDSPTSSTLPPTPPKSLDTMITSQTPQFVNKTQPTDSSVSFPISKDVVTSLSVSETYFNSTETMGTTLSQKFPILTTESHKSPRTLAPVIHLRTTTQTTLKRKTLTAPLTTTHSTTTSPKTTVVMKTVTKTTTSQATGKTSSTTRLPFTSSASDEDKKETSPSTSFPATQDSSDQLVWITEDPEGGGATGIALAITGVVLGLLIAAGVLALFWVRRRKRRLLAEDLDICRLKEETREEERNSSHDVDDDDDDHRRRPFATSYNRLLDNSSGSWATPRPFVEEGTNV